MLDSQTDTADSIQAWASQLGDHHRPAAEPGPGGGRVLNKGAPAADEVRALFDRLQPTLPIVLANLVSLGEVAVTYQPSIEQLLVLFPAGTAQAQASLVTNEHQTGLCRFQQSST